MQDNFFNLGGHSLLAVQILSRVREAFKVELPLSALFDAPTIRDLAAGMNGKRWQSLPNNQPSLMPLPRQGEAPVSFVQERLWFLDQLEPGSHAYNVPVALRLKGPLQVNCLQVAINEVAKRHEVLRTRFAYRENKLIQVIDNFVKIELPITDLRLEHSESREQQARDLVNREAQTPFELSKAPLIRARIVQLEDNDYILVVVMHHTICDGWSFATFYRELEIFYGCFAAGNKNPLLPELPVQYADFAVWRRTCMSGEALNQELSFWKTKLSGAPIKIELPTDRPYPTVAGHKANRCSIQITQDLAQATTQLSNGEGGTPFMLLMTALAVTLHKWSAQQDLVIGTVVAGRTRHELENLIGCFMNFLPIRARLLGTESLGDIFTEVRTAVLEAQEHQDCPFEKIVEAINPERRTNQNPLYNVALLLQNFPAEPFHAEGIRAISFPVSMEAALLDLRFEAEPSSDGLTLNCEYRVDLFERTTIERLLALFHTVLTAILQSPRTQLNEIELPAGLQLQLENSRIQSQKHLLAISSNFTAEPLAESLTYWMQEIQLPAVVEFAGYNQIFQELLNPKSLFGTNELGMNIIVVRLEDWEKGNGGTNQSPDLDHLERNISEFLLSLKGAVQRSNVPFLVCVCPPSPAVLKDTRRYEVQTRMERRLATELDPVGGVYLLFPDELRRWYPVHDYYDEAGEELGHIPYTPLFFAALGTAIVRKYHCLRRPGFKVIALDCDNTLWSGVCGEDGPKGIVLDEAREALQKFMRNQRDAGVLLCLCSKNNEEDVHAVFEQRIDFPLKREHLSGWRLNWSPKSQNLKSLAQELNLGLESFIFVDDNPVECAEVEANCPQVQILQLPDEPAQIPTILEHCWAFDHLKLTSEDKQRAEMYKQNREREALRANALSLGDFIAGLDLKIEMEPLSSEQLVRVSQLTQRTNQFNFTTRRRTEMELQTLGDNYNILTVCVRDRFGDYGLTGVLIFQTESDALDVDSFLLSCRVLGRGVEHRMLAELGEIARERRLQWVNVHFNPTPKNKPAADFLENIGSAFKQPLNGGFLYRFPAGFAADVELNTQGDEALAPAEFATKEASSKNNEPLKVTLQKFTRFREIALNSNDPKQIQTRIEAHKGNVKKPNSVSGDEPITELETQLRELWQNLLHIEQIGIDDNFFEIGGHSLLAVRLFSELQRLTGRKYPLITLFRAPTIRTLAAELSSNQTNNSKSLLVPIQPKGTKPPLFLIHGAGGDVLWGYANLAAHMSKDQPIYGIKSRGQTGEPEFQHVEDMAEFYIREIRELQPHGPYYLGGYCFGGNVAYRWLDDSKT